jgi:hypothetical protein
VRSVIARWGAGIAAVGVLALAVGTFLPWLRSGSVLRDSFQSIGAVRGVIDPGPVAGALLDAWLAVIPVCSLCLALYALRLRRSAAALTCVLAIPVGTAAGLLAVQGGDQDALLGMATTGPVVSMVGAGLAFAGAIAVLAGRGGRPRTAGGDS